jgi:hypothetical protein
VIAHLEELLAMCDIKISDRRAVHEQNNLLGRAGKEIIAKLASMKRVAAGKPASTISKLDWPNHEFLSIRQPAEWYHFISVSIPCARPYRSRLHPRSGDNIDPSLH